jgi:hypothetical protein
MNHSKLTAMASAAVVLLAASEASAQDATAAPPARDEVLLGAGVHQGGYGAPEVKLTSLTGDPALLAGAQIGWIIDRSFVLGLAGYGLTTAHSPVPELSSPVQPSRIGFGYGGVRLAYVFTPQRLVHVSTGALIGAGGVTAITRELTYDPVDRDTSEQWRAHHGGAFFAAEPTLEVEINVHRWVRVALSGSYRVVTDTDRPGFKSSDLSGPAGGLAIKLGTF